MISPGRRSVKAGVALSGIESDVEVGVWLNLVHQHCHDIVAGDSSSFRIGSGQDTMTQDGMSHGPNISCRRVIASMEKMARALAASTR